MSSLQLRQQREQLVQQRELRQQREQLVQQREHLDAWYHAWTEYGEGAASMIWVVSAMAVVVVAVDVRLQP